MRTVVIAAAFLGLLVGIASAMPAATKVHNATPITKAGTNCQTHCYNAGGQRFCNTQCF
jgi:hypothetical protein